MISKKVFSEPKSCLAEEWFLKAETIKSASIVTIHGESRYHIVLVKNNFKSYRTLKNIAVFAWLNLLMGSNGKSNYFLYLVAQEALVSQ